MMQFYREMETGDLLCADTGDTPYRGVRAESGNVEAVATCIAQLPTSLCWTSVSQTFLNEECQKVDRLEVERRTGEEPAWGTLLFRADWFGEELVKSSGEHPLLPYPPEGME